MAGVATQRGDGIQRLGRLEVNSAFGRAGCFVNWLTATTWQMEGERVGAINQTDK